MRSWFAAAVTVAALSYAAACKPANMSGSGGKKSGGASRDDKSGEGTELGSSAPGQGTGSGSTVGSGTGTGPGEYNDSPVTIPASMSGAFLICPMVETMGRPEVDAEEDMFGCAATPDGKDLLPLDGYTVEWRVDDAMGVALPVVQLEAPARSLFHRLFVLDKTKIKATTRVRAAIVDRTTALKIKDIEGFVLVDKRAPFPQIGDADEGTCSVCEQNSSGTGSGTDTGTGTGTGTGP